MKRLVFITTIFLLTSCSNDPFILDHSSSNSTLPITTEIYKPPLSMSFHSVSHTDNRISFSFIVEHIDDFPIASDDYQFHWPKYISDDNDVVYEVKNIDYSHSQIDSLPLTNNQLAVTLTLSPPPQGSLNQLLHVPFYIVPRLFEQGYPFQVSKEDVDRMEVGDLLLENISVKGKTLSFELFDNHPDKNHRKLAYLFTRIQDNQEIYPMFSKVDSEENHLSIQLEFAQSIALPARFSIERTTVDLPEWRFSFVIPMNEDKLE